MASNDDPDLKAIYERHRKMAAGKFHGKTGDPLGPRKKPPVRWAPAAWGMH